MYGILYARTGNLHDCRYRWKKSFCIVLLNSFGDTGFSWRQRFIELKLISSAAIDCQTPQMRTSFWVPAVSFNVSFHLLVSFQSVCHCLLQNVSVQIRLSTLFQCGRAILRLLSPFSRLMASHTIPHLTVRHTMQNNSVDRRFKCRQTLLGAQI